LRDDTKNGCVADYSLPRSRFSLSFKVDSYDVNVGGLVARCCRQFQAFTLSL